MVSYTLPLLFDLPGGRPWPSLYIFDLPHTGWPRPRESLAINPEFSCFAQPVPTAPSAELLTHLYFLYLGWAFCAFEIPTHR